MNCKDNQRVAVAKKNYANTMELEGMDSMEIKTLRCVFLSGRSP